MRWSLISTLATAVLAVTRARTATTTLAVGLVPVGARELLTILRAAALPPLRHDIGHVLPGPPGDAVTKPSRKPATGAGTTSPPPRPHGTTMTTQNYSCRVRSASTRRS
jgi:hypothetical protein